MEEEYQSWTVTGHPVEVTYKNSAMESMRQAAMSGLQQIPKRGLEVGGVLFGTRSGDQVRVEQWREMPCEHAMGPGFQLSESDREQLGQLLADAGVDPELGDLVPVGWYHTRTVGDVSVSDTDVELHNKFFPEPWQIILVIRPRMYDPSQAGFFFREKGGRIHGERSYSEFELATTRRRVPLGYDPSRSPRRPAANQPEPGESVPEPEPSPRLEVPARPPAPRRQRVVPLPMPPPNREFPAKLIPGLFAALLVAMVVVALALPAFEDRREAALNLSARDVGDQLIVEWNPRAATVEVSSLASLRILDGTTERRVDLSVEELKGGNIVYQPLTDDVEVHLTIKGTDGQERTEATRFLSGELPSGTRQPAPDADVSAEAEQLAQELERLRGDLETELNRTAQTKMQVEVLRKRLGIGSR